jgi:HD superfamily phosphodiesterase
MKRSGYEAIENYMPDCMSDSSHHPQHVYRVLYTALRPAKTADVDLDILIASCQLK